MKTSSSCYSSGHSGTKKKKCTRNRNNRNTKWSQKQDHKESTIFTHMAHMESQLRAQADSARLQFYKHQSAWWKSQFVAAQFENRMLRQLLDQHYATPSPTSLPKPPVYTKTEKSKRPNSKRSAELFSSGATDEDSEGSGSESDDYELSEEFKHFLDINRKHREERDKKKAQIRKERGSESETERVERMEQIPIDAGEVIRREQLQQLYGEGWRQVEGLETHTRMLHDQFCDRHQPPLWPNIPLNL